MWVSVERKMPMETYRKGVSFSDPVLVKVDSETRVGYTFNGKWRVAKPNGNFYSESKVTAWADMPDDYPA